MLRDNLVELIEPMLNSAGADPLALYIHTRTPASDDRLPCLKNPRPEGAESSLTESASSPFQAEPAHHEQRVVDIELEKTLRGKVGKQTFPLRLGIPQKTRDSHFPTAATTTALRLHFKWRDDPPHGYILKWLDAEETNLLVSPDLPQQVMWGFDGIVPGPTYVARYGEPILVRNFNQLPRNNAGFGLPSVSTHLHNGHTPSESDGNPCDFFEIGSWYDQHYPNVLAGILSTHPGSGDINESF